MAFVFEKEIDRFGRVIIPKHIRDELNITENDTLMITTSGESIVIVKDIDARSKPHPVLKIIEKKEQE